MQPRRALSGLFLVLLSACSDEVEPRSRFFGEQALLAADEPGSVLFQDDYRVRDQLSVGVLTGDLEAALGARVVDDIFGPSSLVAVLVGAAPAGESATLELRYGAEPLDEIRVEFATEGDLGLRGPPPSQATTPSEEPLGALCVLEGAQIIALVARRAADGRWLDATFPLGSSAEVDSVGASVSVSGAYGGVWAASFTAPVADTVGLEVTSEGDERTWTGDVRVVRADDLVRLDLQTPTEDGIARGTLIAVLRTADGCPVTGADVTLEVAGAQTARASGWSSAAGSGAIEGMLVSATWGQLSASAVY